jgi:hypothetical protein
MRARLKPEIWDVWQYLSNEGVRPLWVLNDTKLVDGVLYLWPGAHGVALEIGEWLVRTGGGIERESDEAFRRDYEVVE